MRDEAEVLEGAHVPVEKGHLILARIEPGEVAPRVHQPQDEHPRLAPLGAHVDEHLEEVDLAEVAGLVHERDEHLLPPALPLRDHFPHHAVADDMALRQEQLVQARRGQSLLAACPARRLREQLLEARPDALLDRTRALDRRPHARRGALDVAPDRVARHAQLSRRPSNGDFLNEHLVPNHIGLIHPQHPPAEKPVPMTGNFSASAGWISFRPPNGSLSRRRHHQISWAGKVGSPAHVATPSTPSGRRTRRTSASALAGSGSRNSTKAMTTASKLAGRNPRRAASIAATGTDFGARASITAAISIPKSDARGAARAMSGSRAPTPVPTSRMR